MIGLVVLLAVIIVLLLFSIWLLTVLDISGMDSKYLKYVVVGAFPVALFLLVISYLRMVDDIEKETNTYGELLKGIANVVIGPPTTTTNSDSDLRANQFANQPVNQSAQPNSQLSEGQF